MKINLSSFFALFIILVIYSTTIDCTSGKRRNLAFLKDSLSYNLINFVIESKFNNFQGDYSRCKYLVDKDQYGVLSREDSLRLLCLDTIFNKNDLVTLFKQNYISKDLFLDPKHLNVKITFIPSDTLIAFQNDTISDFWEKYYKKYGRYGFAIIAPPCFHQIGKRQ